MTGKEVLGLSLNLLFEETDEYDGVAVSFLNLLIPELYVTEQQLRAVNGLEALEKVPYLASLADDIPYNEELTRAALPFGLAAHIAFDDGDMGKVSYFRQLYVNAVNTFTAALPETVVDAYA